MKASKVIDIIAVIFMVVGAIWFFASWHEVVTNNMTPGYVYSAWNLFELLF